MVHPRTASAQDGGNHGNLLAALAFGTGIGQGLVLAVPTLGLAATGAPPHRGWGWAGVVIAGLQIPVSVACVWSTVAVHEMTSDGAQAAVYVTHGLVLAWSAGVIAWSARRLRETDPERVVTPIVMPFRGGAGAGVVLAF